MKGKWLRRLTTVVQWSLDLGALIRIILIYMYTGTPCLTCLYLMRFSNLIRDRETRYHDSWQGPLAYLRRPGYRLSHKSTSNDICSDRHPRGTPTVYSLKEVTFAFLENYIRKKFTVTSNTPKDL